MDRGPKSSQTALIVLAVLAVIAALYLLKAILVPIALAMLLACLLFPVTTFLRRLLPLGPTSAAVLLFLLTVLCGLYGASLAAESLVQAANTLPSDIERLSGQLSRRITDMSRDHPSLRGILPEPGTIDLLGDTNRALVIDSLSSGLTGLSIRVGQGLIILILVLFLLAESEMLTPKVIRFFAPTPGDAQSAGRTLAHLTRQIRAYLVARTLINLVFGAAVALALWLLRVKFPVALGLFAALTNFIPYVGQIIGGALPTLIVIGQSGSIGDALIVAAVYLAIVGLEGYVVTPYIMGRSLDMNGTTVLIACLFWGFLWGLVGLVLAMPITVSLKLIFQTVPELNRWAELMSRDWQTPAAETRVEDHLPAPPPDHPGSPGLDADVALPHAPASASAGRG
ncbi:MAG: AI-2E family transporter [Planctomycetaceae bacterium]|nr:AI-2E family transporter [Planctomycetaceae bacterium]